MGKVNIALIGPVAPYRGGIAQYTTQLAGALAEAAELHVFSFKKLYPKWLYPGKSDKEPGMVEYRMPGVRYSLNIYSPFSLRKTADEIVKAGCEVAVITWWTLIWQPGFAYVARRLKKRGVKVVFLCHNLFDHDAKGLKRRISETLLRQADAYIVHSTEEKEMLSTIKPGALVMQRILPVYGQFPEPNETLEKRGRLEILFFGFIRPYKGLDVLIDALALLKDQDVYLTVAGETWDDEKALREQLVNAGVPNLELHLEYVDDQSAANYFARADVVALPYRSATGSAVLALAYNYRRPVLATKVGGLQDGVIDNETGWLVAPASPEALAEAVAKINRKDLSVMEQKIQQLCEENTWSNMAEAVALFADKVRGNA